MKLGLIAQSIEQALSLSKNLTKTLTAVGVAAALSAPVMANTLSNPNLNGETGDNQPTEEETMYAPQDYISDFPGEMISLQGREIKLVYDEVNIPGNGGLDIVVKRRTNFWGDLGILLPAVNLDPDVDGINGFSDACLGNYDSLNVYLGGDRLTAAGVSTTADVPSGVLAVYSNNVYLACDPGNSNIAELHMPDGLKHRFILESNVSVRNLKLFETLDRYGNRINYEWEHRYHDGQIIGRRLSKITRVDSPNSNQEVNFTYGSVNLNSGSTAERLTQISWNGKTVNYEYNGRGKITSATDSVGRTTKYEYHPSNDENWLNKITTPTGLSVTYEFLKPNGYPGSGGANVKGAGQNNFNTVKNKQQTNNLRPLDDWIMGGENNFSISSRTVEGPGINKRVFTYHDRAYADTAEKLLFIVQKNDGEDKELITEYKFSHAPNTNLHGRTNRVRLFNTATTNNRDYMSLPAGDLLYQKDTSWQAIGTSTNIGCTDRTRTSFSQQQDCTRYVTSATSTKIRNSDGDDVFTTTYSEFNAYGTSGKQVQQFGSNNRIIKQSYDQDIDQWILNQPRIKQIGATEGTLETVEENVYYDKNHSSYPFYLEQTKAFGVWQKKYSQYHSHGGVKKVEYNAPLTAGGLSANRYTEYDNYKLGVAQITKVPERYGSGTLTSSKYINDSTAIRTEVETDFNGKVVYKGFDDKGRPLYVDYKDYAGEHLADILYEYIEWDDETSANPKIVEKRCVLNDAKTACAGDVFLTTTTTHSAKMQPLTVAKTDGSTTIYQNTKYDEFDRAIQVSYPSYVAGQEQGKTTTYDGLGRVKTLSVYGGGTTSTNYLTGNKLEVTDPRGNVTTTTYQAFDGPGYKTATKIESPESVTTDIEVNVLGETLSVTQSGLRNGQIISDVETRLYNSQHQLCMIKRNDVGNTFIKYNALGETLWQAAGVSGTSCSNDGGTLANQKITFTYDNLGDKWVESFGDNTPQRTYTLDGNGNIKEIRTTDFVQSYNYNSINALEDETLNIVADNKVFTLDYGYDAMGSLASLKYPGDTQPIEYAPDAFGRATKAVRNFNGLEDVFAFPGATYHANGIIESFTYGNGILHQTNINTRLAPQHINDFGIVDLTYGYDNNNNITSLLNARENGAYSLTHLNYDGLDRLTSTVGGTKIGSSNLSYDGLGNILTYSNNSSVNGHDLTYSYDSNMRLSGLSGNGSADYDFLQSNAVGGDNNDSYDSRGNVIHNGKRGFEYNLAGQMVKSENYNYLYDGHNRRIRVEDSKGVSYSFYSQSGRLLYRETTNGGINYIFLGEKQIAKEGAGVNVQAGSNMNYTPFGKSLETSRDDIGYTGHKFDRSLGLNYMQARYYDPVIGRFYSNDPIDAISHLSTLNGIHGFNRYAYANNNPYRYNDPTGMNSQNVVPTYLKGKSAGEIEEMLKEEKSKPKNQQNKQKIKDLQKAQKGLGVRNKQKRKNLRRGGGGRAGLAIALVNFLVELFTDNDAEASENEDSSQDQSEQEKEEKEEKEEQI